MGDGCSVEVADYSTAYRRRRRRRERAFSGRRQWTSLNYGNDAPIFWDCNGGW